MLIGIINLYDQCSSGWVTIYKAPQKLTPSSFLHARLSHRTTSQANESAAPLLADDPPRAAPAPRERLTVPIDAYRPLPVTLSQHTHACSLPQTQGIGERAEGGSSVAPLLAHAPHSLLGRRVQAWNPQRLRRSAEPRVIQ